MKQKNNLDKSIFYEIRKDKKQLARYKNRANVISDCKISDHRLRIIENQSTWKEITLSELMLLNGIYRNTDLIEIIFRNLKGEK